jgi:hypothetical protein
MKTNLSRNEWIAEFQEFVSGAEVQPPKNLGTEILSRIHESLNPRAWVVFTKVALIHLFVGTATLLFCPQFGVNLLGSMGLMAVFMRFGEVACMLGCGAVFLGASALTSSFILRPEEVRTIRRTELLQFSILGLLSISVFICTGAAAIGSLAAAWFLGSVLGGLATLELGWMIRTQFRRRLVYGL